MLRNLPSKITFHPKSTDLYSDSTSNKILNYLTCHHFWTVNATRMSSLEEKINKYKAKTFKFIVYLKGGQLGL